jgi:uroporphyrinogen decarboxylase
MNSIQNCLIKKSSTITPIWLMRQAGRYLPEFRKIRKSNPNFIKLCLNSNLSSEITLQPMRRFDLDAAIIFSDILMVPYGLGQTVEFKKNRGPVLSSFNMNKFMNNTEIQFTNKLKPIYDAIKKTRKKLNKKKSLISFVGSPWTLIVYMLGLKKEKNVLDIEKLKKKNSEINLILKNINYFLTIHIKNQINAGADVVQIFDSWAGLIPNKKLEEYCYIPNKKLVDFVKNNKTPVICFPKGLKKKYRSFLDIVRPDGLNIDYNIDPEWARKNLEGTCLQGGMNPKILLTNKKKIIEEATKYLKIFKDSPYIFNLGHGMLPEINPNNVETLIQCVKEYK